MKAKIKIFCSLFLVFASSCTKGPVAFSDPSHYSDYLKDPENSLRKEKTFGDLSFAVQFKTPEYILMEEQGIYPDDRQWDEFKNELNGNLHFTFRISSLSGNDPMTNAPAVEEDYSTQLQYFSFQAQRDFFLLNGNDTLPCKNFLFERNYGMSPHMTFLMVFDTLSQMNGDGLRFVYYDKIFGKGPIQFHYTKETLSTIPKLI